MSNVHELTVGHLGLVVESRSHGEYAEFGDRHGNRIVRISHEAELRWGTFVGYGHTFDQSNLQHWGHFYPESNPGIFYDGEQPSGSTELTTAGELHRAHLTPVSGVRVRPADMVDPPAGSGWDLIRVEYDYTWDQEPYVKLIYAPEPNLGPFTDGPRDYRINVSPDTVMVPA